MFRWFAGIALLLLTGPRLAVAQVAGTLVEGQRIRVGYRCGVSHDRVVDCRESRYPRVDTGHLQALDSATIRLRTPSRDSALVIPRASVAQLWVAEGTRRNFWAGAGIGLMGGALLGAAIGSTLEFCILSCSPATGLGFIMGAPAGFLIGGLVGAASRSDRWRAVPSSGPRISLGPRSVRITVPGPF